MFFNNFKLLLIFLHRTQVAKHTLNIFFIGATFFYQICFRFKSYLITLIKVQKYSFCNQNAFRFTVYLWLIIIFFFKRPLISLKMTEILTSLHCTEIINECIYPYNILSNVSRKLNILEKLIGIWNIMLLVVLVYNIITFTYISILSTKISYSVLESSKPTHRNQT